MRYWTFCNRSVWSRLVIAYITSTNDPEDDGSAKWWPRPVSDRCELPLSLAFDSLACFLVHVVVGDLHSVSDDTAVARVVLPVSLTHVYTRGLAQSS